MVRIETVGRVSAAQVAPSRDTQALPDGAASKAAAEPRGRALVAIDGGRRDEPRRPALDGAARPGAGFITHLMVAADPGLRPSRLERTRAAAACYAETARRLA